MNRKTLALLATLTGASIAVADLPRPPGEVSITPRLRFVGVQKYADHVFYVRVSSYTRNIVPETTQRFEVPNADPISLFVGESITSIHLLAMPFEEFKKRQAEDPSLDWLNPNMPNILSAQLDCPPTRGRAGKAPVTVYNVTLSKGRLSATKSLFRTGWLDSLDFPLHSWFFGAACAFSLSLFGLWLVRRRRGNP